jgi:orotidine-5'-phosphate decarboxylase
MDATKRICVALDTDKNCALSIAEGIAHSSKSYALGCLKINSLVDQEATDGHSLTRPLFKTLKEFGVPVWADVKLHDIPRTVVRRIKPYVETGCVKYVTVMAKGGIDMMRVAVRCGHKMTEVIAVTELTSFNEEDVHLLSGQPVKASVINLARHAVLAGVEYIVCSGHELKTIRNYEELQHLKLFVPAIRPAWSQVNTSDQKRVMTPVEAFMQSADMVVIGSSIVDAVDPVDAFNRTVDEIEQANEEEDA